MKNEEPEVTRERVRNLLVAVEQYSDARNMAGVHKALAALSKETKRYSMLPTVSEKGGEILSWRDGTKEERKARPGLMHYSLRKAGNGRDLLLEIDAYKSHPYVLTKEPRMEQKIVDGEPSAIIEFRGSRYGGQIGVDKLSEWIRFLSDKPAKPNLRMVAG